MPRQGFPFSVTTGGDSGYSDETGLCANVILLAVDFTLEGTVPRFTGIAQLREASFFVFFVYSRRGELQGVVRNCICQGILYNPVFYV